MNKSQNGVNRMNKFEKIIGKKLPFQVGDVVRQYSQNMKGQLTYGNSKVTYITLVHDPRYCKLPFISINLDPEAEGTDTRNYGYRPSIELDLETLEERRPIVIDGKKYLRLQSISEPIYEGAI